MRVILFKGVIQSLDCLVDELSFQLKCAGHTVFVSDLSHFESGALMDFCKESVDAAICYDGFAVFDKTILPY